MQEPVFAMLINFFHGLRNGERPGDDPGIPGPAGALRQRLVFANIDEFYLPEPRRAW